MRGLDELYIAYTVIWLGVFGYMLYLHMRQQKLLKDVKNLEGMLSDRGS
ncbi:MAG: CcmD family protein [Thermoplasmata archaeon]|nr:CcmD family protein [Thermoplasmata archaeon]